ncbi:MAG: type IX secretion system membrane protein PorP/SprF [Bacteroidales bacterium]|jgi:type IX secretion system PorP/SprF family membrane protein|nr:type IX secretion system membrane protein PorP/SprF [Bacteroidales bacterium]
MKRSVIILLFLIASNVSMFAQTQNQFTLFPWAAPYFNAGAIGEQNNTLCFTAIFSQQKTGWHDVYEKEGKTIKDNTSPQQLYFALESYLKPLHGSLGLTFIKDKLGYCDNIGVKLGYAFKMNIPTGKLSIGAQIGLYNTKLDGEKLRYQHDNDPLIENVKSSESFMDLDFHFGIFYKAERWYAGIGSTKMAASTKLRLSGDPNVFSNSRQIYVHGGYTWVMPANPSWEIEPQAILTTTLSSNFDYSFTIMALARYNKVYWGGLSYRFNDDISVLFGARPFYNNSNNYLKGLDMGLSYGFPTNKMGVHQRSFGSIEVMVRYCFDIYKEPVYSGYGSTRSIYKNQY